MENIDKFKTIKEIEEYRKSINEACDNRAKFVTLCNRAGQLSEKPFLFIKESFESLAPTLFLTTEGKKLINKYKSTIKGSSNLKALHSLCENIRKANKEIDTTYFVNNITECNWGVDKNTVSEDLNKLGRVLAEAYLYIGNDAEKHIVAENLALSKAIDYIAMNAKTNKNITEYSSAVKVIRENVEKIEDGVNVFEQKTLAEAAESLIESFNKKFAGELNDDEAELIKEVASNPDKKSIFDRRKGICVERINEAIENSDNAEEKERLSVIKEQVSNKTYNEKTFGDDICKLLTMTSVLG